MGGVTAVKQATLDDLKALAWLPDAVAESDLRTSCTRPGRGRSGASVAAALAHLRTNDD